MYSDSPALFTTFSAPIDTKHFLFAPPRTYMHILLLSHSPLHTFTLTYVHTHTRTLSSPVLFPYVSFFRLIKCAAPSLAPLPFPGEEIRCDTTVFAQEVKRYSATPCRPLTQLIRLMGWQVPAERHTHTHNHCSLVTGSVTLISNLSNTCYWHSSYRSIKIQFWSALPSIKHSMHNSDIAGEPLG